MYPIEPLDRPAEERRGRILRTVMVSCAILAPIVFVVPAVVERDEPVAVATAAGSPGAVAPLVTAATSLPGTTPASATVTTGAALEPTTTGAADAATLADQAPATVAASEAPAATVARKVPATTAKPKAPATTAPSKTPATTAKPKAPATTAKPKTPATTAKPKTPTTTAKPKSPASTTPPTTAPPKSTTTTAPPAPPKRTWTRAEVEQIVRDAFPDDLEEKALSIVKRESNFLPHAYNGWCCYGLFQIHFGANQRFLAGLGVTDARQLLDPVVNTRVAWALYQAAGWRPWGG